jgi:hypothetical protein
MAVVVKLEPDKIWPDPQHSCMYPITNLSIQKIYHKIEYIFTITMNVPFLLFSIKDDL